MRRTRGIGQAQKKLGIPDCPKASVGLDIIGPQAEQEGLNLHSSKTGLRDQGQMGAKLFILNAPTWPPPPCDGSVFTRG
ncbi:hypothetical protein MK280_18885, partial [Myxococcota bacterium]|nr:hypothetical protein [Myxococcota bacterium]